jgi:hypothetical protein
MIETMVQFSVFMANKPGLLGRICRGLAAAKVNIVAMTMMDAKEHGVLRLVAKDADKAKAALHDMNLSMTQTRVLAVSMPNRPGAVADVCEKLSANRVPISYLYSTTGAAGGKATAIFNVQNMDKAVRVLESKRGSGRDMRVKLRSRQRAKVGNRR